MQAVQQEDDQLLAVLLAVTLELRRKLGQLSLEAVWPDRIRSLLHIATMINKRNLLCWLWLRATAARQPFADLPQMLANMAI